MPNKYQIWWQLVFCCKWRGGPYLIILDVVWHTGNNSLVMCHGVGIISNYSQVSPHGGGAKVAYMWGMSVLGFSSQNRLSPSLDLNSNLNVGPHPLGLKTRRNSFLIQWARTQQNIRMSTNVKIPPKNPRWWETHLCEVRGCLQGWAYPSYCIHTWR